MCLGHSLTKMLMLRTIKAFCWQLCHQVGNTNGRAYNRTLEIKQRTEMMQEWNDYLNQLREKGLNV
jgi:hypothetical protein